MDMSVREAQRLRMRRSLWGLTGQGASLFIAVLLYWYDMLPAVNLLVYLALVLVVALPFFILILLGRNLRFADPSMTAAQIISSLWPAIFTMFFVTDPQARTAFLFIATGGLLFGMFALRRRDMLLVSLTIVGSYLILLMALQRLEPSRIDWRAESVVVFAYAVVLVMIAYIGSYIADIRHRLRQQNRRLEELATRDPLTQLPNRRSLMTQLQRESSRTARRSPEQDDLCVSMLDIDLFKPINDTWGHDVGDRVLHRVACTLREELREGDFVGRFGGEEFVLVLPETTLDAAREAAERVRSAVEALRFDGLPDIGSITVSQGVALHQPGEHIEDTLKRADQALYRAKEAGRNRVVVCD